MSSNELLGVPPFAAERACANNFAYVHSRISRSY
ncbi:hypothetical protein ACP70R_035861 [Stipagrostis hirtigluma subsp. patula]